MQEPGGSGSWHTIASHVQADADDTSSSSIPSCVTSYFERSRDHWNTDSCVMRMCMASIPSVGY